MRRVGFGDGVVCLFGGVGLRGCVFCVCFFCLGCLYVLRW